MIQTVRSILTRINQDGPASTTFWLVAEKGARMVVGMLFNILFFKAIGPNLIGDYGPALATSYIVYPLFTLGLNDILIYQYSHSQELGQTFGTSWLMKVLGGVLVLGIYTAFLLTAVSPSDWQDHFYLYVGLLSQFLMFLAQSVESADYYFQQQGTVRHLIKLKLVSLILFSAIKISLITEGGGPNDFWILMAIPAEVVLSYVLFWMLHKPFRQLLANCGVSVNMWRAMFAHAKIQLPSALVVNTFMRMDVLLIRWVLGNEAMAGIYAAAVRFSEPWLLIPFIVSNSFSSKYYDLRAKLAEKATAFWSDFAAVILLISLGIVGFTWAVAPVIGFYFGDKYPSLAAILSVHVLSIVFSAAGSFGWPWLVSHRYQSQIFWRNLAGIVLMACLSLLLWPILGIVGVAVSLSLSYGLIHVGANAINSKFRPLFLMQIGAIRRLSIQTIRRTLAA